jgi:hypothetical protein
LYRFALSFLLNRNVTAWWERFLTAIKLDLYRFISWLQATLTSLKSTILQGTKKPIK